MDGREKRDSQFKDTKGEREGQINSMEIPLSIHPSIPFLSLTHSPTLPCSLHASYPHPLRMRIFQSINITHTHTGQSKPMSTVVYCASRGNAHFHGHYSPWKQASALTHTWCWRCTRTVAALDNNKLFQGQIADKNPFFHSTKKDHGWRRGSEWDREKSWNQINGGMHLSLKLDLSVFCHHS